MKQSKRESLVESLFNQFTGVLTAFLVWRFIIIPIWNFPDPGITQNITITLIFTVVSILRSYVWRRFFNAGLHKIVHQYVKRVFML